MLVTPRRTTDPGVPALTPATPAPTPGDRDRALALRRRLTTAVGIGGITAVGAVVAAPSEAATAAPTLAPSSSAVSSARSGTVDAVSGGSGGG